MKTILEYLQSGHITKSKTQKAIIAEHMDDYKAINYEELIRLSNVNVSPKIWKEDIDLVKKMYHVSELTKDIIKDFLGYYYSLFITLDFNDKRINKAIYNQLIKNDPKFSSIENILNNFDNKLGKINNTCDNFTYWATPCLFNAFFNIVYTINERK